MGDNTARKPHVLLIYRVMIPSIRLCGHAQMEALARQGVVEYRAVQEMRLRTDDLDWADLVLLGRLDSWYERRLTRMLKGSGRFLAYILDDDLLNIPLNVSSASFYAQPGIQRNIRDMIAMSDGIVSPSPRLLEKYATDGRAAIRIEEPALDPVAYRPHEPGAPVKIGFAGSIDRTEDIEKILKQALLRIKAEYGGKVRFEFFGAVPAFANQLDAKCVPYSEDYDHYRQKLNELAWDIGLAPMPGTPFHACKHYNKFCEYAAAGIAGVYSDCEPYTFIPDRERYGRFCANDSQMWYEQIRSSIEDAVTREAQRQKCCEIAAHELSPESVGQELFREYPALFQPVQALPISKRGTLAVLKACNLVALTVERLHRYGLRAPVVVIEKTVARIRSKH